MFTDDLLRYIKHSESLTYIINEPPTKWPFQL